MAKIEKKDRFELWGVGVLWAAGLLCVICGGLMMLAANSRTATATAATQMLATARIFITFGGIVVFAGLAAALLLILWNFRRAHADQEATVSILRRLLSGQTQLEAVLTQISESLLLSEAIKSVAFRDKDRAVLQDAVRQDIRREQWESASLLTDELEKRFGRREAEKLRQEMSDFRNRTIQDKIDGAIEHINSLWMIHHYEEAEQEVQSLLKMHPDNSTVQALEGQTDQRRQEHKAALLARWDEALQANDIDQGVELLKLLDNHLTPTEAAALQESARGVFRAKLHQMGVQFSLFVAQKKWSQALALGRSIIEEFPNSRMAEEVRSKLDVLVQRAQEE